MKSPIFSMEKLLYFPEKSGIVPIFRKSPSSYISYFCEHTPCNNIVLDDPNQSSAKVHPLLCHYKSSVD